MSRTSTRWAPWTSTVLCLVGLGVSAYLTVEHYSSSTTLACPESATINCVKVTTSSYSELFGIPVALLGLLFFLGLTPLCLPVAWRAASPWPSRLRVTSITLGVAFVIYLVWAELFRIEAICLWCTVVHAVTLLLFFVVVLDAALRPLDDDADLSSDLPPRRPGASRTRAADRSGLAGSLTGPTCHGGKSRLRFPSWKAMEDQSPRTAATSAASRRLRRSRRSTTRARS